MRVTLTQLVEDLNNLVESLESKGINPSEVSIHSLSCGHRSTIESRVNKWGFISSQGNMKLVFGTDYEDYPDYNAGDFEDANGIFPDLYQKDTREDEDYAMDSPSNQ